MVHAFVLTFMNGFFFARTHKRCVGYVHVCTYRPKSTLCALYIASVPGLPLTLRARFNCAGVGKSKPELRFAHPRAIKTRT